MHVLPYLSYIPSLIISLLFPFLIQIFLCTAIPCFPSSFCHIITHNYPLISFPDTNISAQDDPIYVSEFTSSPWLLSWIFLRKMILYMFPNLRALHGYWAKWQLLHLFSAAFFFPYHRMCMCVLTRCLLGLVSSSQFNTLRPVRDSSEPIGNKSRKKLNLCGGIGI